MWKRGDRETMTKRTFNLNKITEERIKNYMKKERLGSMTETIQVMIARCISYERILDMMKFVAEREEKRKEAIRG